MAIHRDSLMVLIMPLLSTQNIVFYLSSIFSAIIAVGVVSVNGFFGFLWPLCLICGSEFHIIVLIMGVM